MGGEDDVQKVGRTSGKILTTPLLKPEKTTGVLNVLIMCPGWHFQESADQESFMTKWKLLVASSPKTSDNSAVVSGRSVKCNAIFAVCDLSALGCWYVLPCGYLTFPIHGNTMLRYEQQTFTTLFCRLKSDFMDVKRFEYVRRFDISGLPSLDKLTWLLHLAGVGSLNLPFLIGNGFNLYQIAV